MSKKYDPEVFELLKVWYFLKSGEFLWPEAVTALEDKISELLEMSKDEWQAKPLNNPSHHN